MPPQRALVAAVAFAVTVAQGPVLAQEGDGAVKPGLYTSVQQDEIYIIQGGQQYDVRTGETVFVDPSGLQFIDAPPSFLNWPCGTDLAPNRGNLPTFPASDLPAGEELVTVAQRYFYEGQVLEGSPRFLAGESHLSLPSSQLDAYRSNVQWYQSGPPDHPLAGQRPDTLIIKMFYGTGQVAIDNNHYEALKEQYGDDPIPVVIQYEEENIVPMSYFGQDPTPQMLIDAYKEQGLRPADVPMWYAGDQHGEFPPGELADLAGIPPASEMDPAELQAAMDDIRQNGFAGKPITMAMAQGGDKPLIDEETRLRAAQQLGVPAVPVLFSFYDAGSVSGFCGLAPPVAAMGILGTFTDDPAATPPDEGQGDGTVPPPGQPGGPDGPIIPPTIPPEIELPNPPQPELPASPAGEEDDFQG